MHLIPLALGVLAILIGIAMVGFGIPINEFGTGNTLIAAGTTAVVGGFILLGLWVGVLQLQRLVGALEPRSARAARGRGEVAASDLDHARRQLEAEDAGLAPLREPLPATEETAERGPARHSSEQPAERTSWLPPLEEPEPRIRERPGAGGDEHLETREKASSWELFAPSRTSSPARERSFDAIWPSDRPAREERGTAQPGDRGRTEQRGAEPTPAPPAGSPSATILKSGVINGMAYTLYTDGSIEAELPQGTLRFGSLDELRDYLGGNI